jgi:hypothetical protein
MNLFKQQTATQLYRHGDILVGATAVLPEDATARPGATVLAWGEVTGHSHRIEDPRTATLYEHSGIGYLQVTAPNARLIHEEHGPITLPRGTYRFWHQREYTPQAIRRVID